MCNLTAELTKPKILKYKINGKDFIFKSNCEYGSSYTSIDKELVDYLDALQLTLIAFENNINLRCKNKYDSVRTERKVESFLGKFYKLNEDDFISILKAEIRKIKINELLK